MSLFLCEYHRINLGWLVGWLIAPLVSGLINVLVLKMGADETRLIIIEKPVERQGYWKERR